MVKNQNILVKIFVSNKIIRRFAHSFYGRSMPISKVEITSDSEK